jgi:hypothetical protein
MRREKLAAPDMLCFSETVDIFQFLNYFAAGNFAYRLMFGSSKVKKKLG